MAVRQLVLAAIVATRLVAQESAPPKRAHHSIVYDHAQKRVLVWGGSSPHDNGDCCAFFNDLWAFDGTRWTSLGETGPKASGVSLAYDTRRNRVVGFGSYAPGAAGGVSSGDLRSLVNDRWTVDGRHPEIMVAEPGFVFDSRRNRYVAFGGSAGRGQEQNDTWEWDGSAWHRIAVAGPPPRVGHVMVFDSRRQRVVVFGGGRPGAPGTPPVRLGDTWEYDGVSWTQRQVDGPPPRMAAGATFDSKRGLVVVFGGMSGDGMLGDTWAWNGTAWRKLAEQGPGARAMGYIAYDANRDRIVLFGGRRGWPDDLRDTWEWNGTSWRQVGR